MIEGGPPGAPVFAKFGTVAFELSFPQFTAIFTNQWARPLAHALAVWPIKAAYEKTDSLIRPWPSPNLSKGSFFERVRRRLPSVVLEMSLRTAAVVCRED